ncbi:glycosyltransferase [Sphaerisporangium sp. TRM90804]|uniref:glycosyltransferase n=1 Tax=Sphaerisporangium sp. TRM90804 TaxID=3031113 RepID=UPI00244CF14E|nr:glycosyltransferase [Sphaerisporangium sp. TRM90804]MDH2426671.1 glycosyltransferase [Sphaerisporangium sp. TRM90804]
MITVVIPTVGRRSLGRTIDAVGPGTPVVVVDDRRRAFPALRVPPGVRVLRTGGRGPAAARNAGWQAAGTPWVAFLDDDVVPGPRWGEALRADLAALPEGVAGSQGRLEVPLPAGRAATDAERDTAGLSRARWATADMAYRVAALEKAGGFDERFPRAYREDADLALRLLAAGHELVVGERVSRHPVRDDGFWSSVRAQRGNADDALMRRVHGAGWRRAVGGAPGRLRRHAAITVLGLLGTVAAVLALTSPAHAPPNARGTFRPGSPPGRDGVRASAARSLIALGPPASPAGRPPRGRRLWALLASGAGAGWLALTAEFVWARLAPGPRTPGEVLRMAVTGVVIPPAACAHRLRGELRVRR